jgi:NAD-dependent deacetylase
MTLPQEQEARVEEAAHIILRSRHVVALVGAGLSVESGIPPFRGPGGLWTKYGEPDMLGYQRFLEDPKSWWEERMRPSPVYRELLEALDQARPNPGHYALKEMEDLGFLHHIITQNIDNLHQEAGSRNITEIHGNRRKLRCIRCHTRWWVEEFEIKEIPPRCPHCGSIVKSDTVMFGEPIPPDALDECIRQTAVCDCMLLVGTSGVVYPAAGFPVDVKRQGGKLIEVNPMETALSDLCDVVIRAPAGLALPALVGKLKELSHRP